MFKKFCCIENADMSRYSTIKLGGHARWLIFPRDEDEFVEAYQISKKAGYEPVVIGNGSNILFDVEFFDGVVISTRYFGRIERLDDARVSVGAGVNLFLLNSKLAQMELGGMEWSYGIPASLGGLIYMNGGAFGSEIKDVLESVTVFDGEKIFELKQESLNFSYRNSGLGKLTVLGGVLKLFNKDSSKILETMAGVLDKRKISQPYEKPSLGSVFKRVQASEVLYPAKMIDSLGLKGVKIGGVQISTKHAGFIINSENGTAEDFKSLVELIEKKVKQKYQIELEREVIYLSERSRR